MYDTARAGPERDVRDPAAFRKEQQIARCVAVTVRRNGDLCTLPELLIAVARQHDATGRVHRLHQPGAVDSPLGASTPEIWSAAVPLLRQFGKREMPGFDPQLLFTPNMAGRDRAALPVRQLDDAAPQRDPCARWKSAAPFGDDDVGAQRASRGALPPVFGPAVRPRCDVSGIEPADVAVRCSNAQPLLAPLEDVERLAVQNFAHPRGLNPGLGKERRERHGDDRCRIAALVGNELDLVDELGFVGEAP